MQHPVANIVYKQQYHKNDVYHHLVLVIIPYEKIEQQNKRRMRKAKLQDTEGQEERGGKN